MKLKKRFIIIPVIMCAVLALALAVYLCFFRYWFASVEDMNKLSRQDDDDEQICWEWLGDDNKIIAFYPKNKYADIIRISQEYDGFRCGKIDWDNDTHRIKLYIDPIEEPYSAYNTTYCTAYQKNRTKILTGEYRFVSEDKMKLYVDEEYVGDITDGEDVLIFERTSTPHYTIFHSEDNYA